MTSGAGGLITTEVLTTDLGTHGGRTLRARVQRRTLRLAFGHVRASFVRLRPLAVEVFEARAGGAPAPRILPIAVPADPLLLPLQRMLILWIVSFALRRVVSRLRSAGKAD